MDGSITLYFRGLRASFAGSRCAPPSFQDGNSFSRHYQTLARLANLQRRSATVSAIKFDIYPLLTSRNPNYYAYDSARKTY